MSDDDSSPRPISFDIDVTHAAPAWRKALPDIDARARQAVRAALLSVPKRLPRAPRLAVSVVLADNAFVRALNAAHRGQDKPTNVLSFPVPAHFRRGGEEAPLGDIVLAFETVAAEAHADGRGLADHTARLIVHGALHLVGHTHESGARARAMRAAERKALDKLHFLAPEAALCA